MPDAVEKKRFTVMVVPHCQKPPVSFKLPLFLLQILGLSLVFVPILLVSFFNSYNSARAVMPELHDLRLENELKSEQIEALAKETQRMLENLQRLRELEQQLMELTDLDDTSQLVPPTNERAQGQPINFRSVFASASRTLTTAERVLSSIEEMDQAIPEQEERMVVLKESIEEQQRREAATPSIWPTWGRVTSPFGWRRDPFNRSWDWHTGIDIAGVNIYGRPVYATAYGRVTFAGYQGGYGYLVIVDHGYGFSTYYAHLSQIRVQRGQQVDRGQIIGNVGRSGRATGAHLHYEVRRWGEPVNPFSYLP